MSKHKKTIQAAVTSGVQSSQTPGVKSTADQIDEFVKENTPVVVLDFEPVSYTVIGSHQCPIKGIPSVTGQPETNFMYSARTQEMSDWLTSKGFQRV